MLLHVAWRGVHLRERVCMVCTAPHHTLAGFAVVKRGRDRHSGEIVAIKVRCVRMFASFIRSCTAQFCSCCTKLLYSNILSILAQETSLGGYDTLLVLHSYSRTLHAPLKGDCSNTGGRQVAVCDRGKQREGDPHPLESAPHELHTAPCRVRDSQACLYCD